MPFLHNRKSWTIQHAKHEDHLNRIFHPPTIVYKFRWYILLAECLLNLTNSFMFSSYAPVANFTDDYYGESTTDYLSMVFLGISVPAMIVAMALAQKAGLRLLIISSAFLNTLGAGVRILSNLNGLSPGLRLALVMIGQALGALANPGTLFLNTKIAATWFPIKQRAEATALLSVATPLGMLICSPIASALVKSEQDLVYLNVVIFVPTFIVFIMTLAIRHSEPPTPPSHTASHLLHRPLSAVEGVRRTLTNRAYWVLLICTAIGLGLFNTLYTMIQQILCSRGYTNEFASIGFALLVGGGLVGSAVVGVIIGRTKRFEEVLKISICIATLGGIAFAETAIVPNMEIAILVAMLVYGTFALSFYAVAVEASAEITFPVDETTSSGIISLTGQLFGVMFITIWNNLTQDLPDYLQNAQQCTVSGQTAAETASVAQDMKVPLLGSHVLGTIATIVFVIFFKPEYFRLEQETEDIKKEEEEVVRKLSILVVPATKF